MFTSRFAVADPPLTTAAPLPSTQPVLRATLRGHDNPVTAIAFRAGAGNLATGDESGAVRIWNTPTQKVVQTFQQQVGSAIVSLTFSPPAEDDAALLSADSSGRLLLYGQTAGDSARLIATIPGLTSIAASYDFARVACTIGKLPETADPETKHVVIHEMQTGKLLSSLDSNFEYASAIARSIDGKLIAVCGGEAPGAVTRTGGRDRDSWIELWDTDKNEQVATLEAGRNALRSPTFSADGRLFAAAGTDVYIWDTSTHQLVATLRAGSFSSTAVAFSGNGRWVATGSSDSTIQYWDTKTWECLHTFQADRSQAVTALAFSPHGRELAVARGSEVLIYSHPAVPFVPKNTSR